MSDDQNFAERYDNILRDDRDFQKYCKEHLEPLVEAEPDDFRRAVVDFMRETVKITAETVEWNSQQRGMFMQAFRDKIDGVDKAAAEAIEQIFGDLEAVKTTCYVLSCIGYKWRTGMWPEVSRRLSFAEMLNYTIPKSPKEQELINKILGETNTPGDDEAEGNGGKPPSQWGVDSALNELRAAKNQIEMMFQGFSNMRPETDVAAVNASYWDVLKNSIEHLESAEGHLSS